MSQDEFEMSEAYVRKIVIDENWKWHFDEGEEFLCQKLEDCPLVVLDGQEYAVVGPLSEYTFKVEKMPEFCRHSYKVLAVPLALEAEPDGRRVCVSLRCDKIGPSHWRVEDEFDAHYTDADDVEEYGSHPVWNPKTGVVERSTIPDKC